MLIAVETAAEILGKDASNFFIRGTKYHKLLIKRDGSAFVDSEGLADFMEKEREKRSRIHEAVTYAQVGRTVEGEREFLHLFPTKIRSEIKKGMRDMHVSERLIEIIMFVCRDRYGDIVRMYNEKGYVPIEYRRHLSHDWVRQHYWLKQETDEDIADMLLVPVGWVRSEIRRLGMQKSKNNIPRRGRKDWRPPNKEEYSRKRRNQPHAKPVVQIDPATGETVRKYTSVGAVRRYGFRREGYAKRSNPTASIWDTCGVVLGWRR